MDGDDIGFAIFVIGIWIALIIFITAIVSATNSKPYCPVGQGTVLDADSNVTGCVILVPQPTPTLVPGQIVPPMVKD